MVISAEITQLDLVMSGIAHNGGSVLFQPSSSTGRASFAFLVLFVLLLFISLHIPMIPSASLWTVRPAAVSASVFDHHLPYFLSSPFAFVDRFGRSNLITHLSYLVRGLVVASSGHAHDDLNTVR